MTGMRKPEENFSLARIEPPIDAGPRGGGGTAVTAIVAEDLACQRGGQIVVSSLNFNVCAGGILVLRGPNGSGKTTLLRTIAGFIPSAAGSIRVIENARSNDSSPPQTGEPAGDGHFHYIGHANGVKPRLSVIENVQFWQCYYGGGNAIEIAEEALDAFALLKLADYSAAHLSQGQSRRLGLARLLAAPRPIWLLDEPSASLDAASTALLERALTRHLASGGLAIVSTHVDISLVDAVTLELGAAPASR